MKNLSTNAAAGLVMSAIVLSACAGSGGGATPSAAAPLAAPALAGDAAAIKFAGQYAGKVQDSKFKKGVAGASLSQYQSAVGGAAAFLFNKKAMGNSVAAIASGKTLSGTMVATLGKSNCTLSFTGTYNTSTYRLSGSYRAIHGCTGETGTYNMKEQCYFVTKSSAAIRRDIHGLDPC